MFLTVFKHFIIVIFIFAFTLFARAQQTHFVYLQTEDGRPFYIKINNKILSSSSAGYLILPNLTDGDYSLSVGFPKKEFPEENFQIAINKKNEGFLLKNFGEKGWGLFNMQFYSVVMGGNTDATASSLKNLQDDPFSRMLANVVKDSSILQKKEPLKEEVPVSAKVDSPVAKIDSTITRVDSSVAKADSSVAKNDSSVAKIDSTITKVDSTVTIVEKTGTLLLSPATLFLSKKNKDGIEMIYIDHNQNLNDTIRIFIPSEKPIVETFNVDTGIVQNVKSSITPHTDTASMVIEPPVSQMKSDTTVVDTTLGVSPEKKKIVANKDTAIAKKMDEVKKPEVNSQDSVVRTGNKAEITKKDDMVVLPKVVQSSSSNSDCKAFAAVQDFLKLRKKMASGNSDDNMIKIAKKAFHAKCFSTEQIKNLSFLFLTNSGKYMFFDLAYPFASDSDQYDTLQSQLTDSYYINRFKAMIHK
jgi:hypothetical protein